MACLRNFVTQLVLYMFGTDNCMIKLQSFYEKLLISRYGCLSKLTLISTCHSKLWKTQSVKPSTSIFDEGSHVTFLLRKILYSLQPTQYQNVKSSPLPFKTAIFTFFLLVSNFIHIDNSEPTAVKFPLSMLTLLKRTINYEVLKFFQTLTPKVSSCRYLPN